MVVSTLNRGRTKINGVVHVRLFYCTDKLLIDNWSYIHNITPLCAIESDNWSYIHNITPLCAIESGQDFYVN